MKTVVIVGGGWSGAGAAMAAIKAGASVTLLERTDMLLGTGLVGGIMRNNGRFTATEEAIALGANELFDCTDRISRHQNIDFPGHKHATLYDVGNIEPAIKEILLDSGVGIHTNQRVTDVEMEGTLIKSVTTHEGSAFKGDVFIDCTGTAGPQSNCAKYGNGCAMCVLRCPSFGPRISLAAKAGVNEFMGLNANGSPGAMSGSCKLHIESLSETLQDRLLSDGVVVIPIPEELKHSEILAVKACQQYALKEYSDNVILLDTGHAKLMTPFFKLDQLRKIPGFENARFEDPYAGGKGNSVRYLAISPRDNCLKIEGVDNLFGGGEKTGLLVGHTEAIITGYLSGANAVRYAVGEDLIELPKSLAIGDAIDFVREQMGNDSGLSQKYTFSGSVLFERMKTLGLYTTDLDVIKERVKATGMIGIFDQKVV